MDSQKSTLVYFGTDSDLNSLKEVSLNEENIHGNTIYENGYKFIYMKYGLDLYGMEFSRMTAKDYRRTTELKFIFIGATNVLLITIVSTDSETYTLWMEQKSNVQEVKNYITAVKQTETYQAEPGFQQVIQQVADSVSNTPNDIKIQEVISTTPGSYVITYETKTGTLYTTEANYKPKTGVTITSSEQIIHPSLVNMVLPESAQETIIHKDKIATNPDAK